MGPHRSAAERSLASEDEGGSKPTAREDRFMVGQVLENVRTACATVAERARLVRIDHQRILPYAATLATDAAPPSYDLAHHYRGGRDDTAAFVLTLDAVNFGSGYFPFLRKRPGHSGYFTIATSLKELFEHDGPFGAADLAAITPAACAALFGQELDGGPVEELVGLFARALNDLGRFLAERFEGRFAGPIEVAGGSAARLVALLATMPFFADVQTYDGLAIPFYKRAQIAVADLSLAFEGRDLGRFADLDRLSCFADNLVPHVLRVDGVLRYDPALAARIDAGEPIPAGSAEEVEIRAAAVHAVELLVAALRETGREATAMGLDGALWNRGQGAAYKARPRHRTRTVFY